MESAGLGSQGSGSRQVLCGPWFWYSDDRRRALGIDSIEDPAGEDSSSICFQRCGLNMNGQTCQDATVPPLQSFRELKDALPEWLLQASMWDARLLPMDKSYPG